LYDFAVKLIRDCLAYVCHQTKAEVKAAALEGPGNAMRCGFELMR
jgi:glutamyl/glutaminyl-tRNA synthetase